MESLLIEHLLVFGKQEVKDQYFVLQFVIRQHAANEVKVLLNRDSLGLREKAHEEEVFKELDTAFGEYLNHHLTHRILRQFLQAALDLRQVGREQTYSNPLAQVKLVF